MIIADNKWFTRVVAAPIIQTLDSLRLKYPEVGPDKGWHGFKRYVGLGVLAYNLHKIGRRLLERRPQSKPLKMLCE